MADVAPPVLARRARGPAAGGLVVRKLRALDAELATAIPRVLADADDEAIHDLRVAIRRLRTLLKLARRSVERARRSVEKQRDAATDDAVALHELRIAYKELRYAAELLADALPADLSAMADPASRFQKRLGEIHDADMAVAALKRARGLDPATRADVLARLEALRAKRVAKYVAEMAPSAGDPATPEPPASETLLRELTPSAASRSGRSPAS